MVDFFRENYPPPLKKIIENNFWTGLKNGVIVILILFFFLTLLTLLNLGEFDNFSPFLIS